MFGKKANGNELAPPPVASEASSREVLRVWTTPDSGNEFSLHVTWKDPAAWGLLLADLAQHAARAYEQQGLSEHEALDRIWQGLRAERSSPTDGT